VGSTSLNVIAAQAVTLDEQEESLRLDVNNILMILNMIEINLDTHSIFSAQNTK
jgi:hypothetical protein